MLCTPKHSAVNIALHHNLHRIEETCPLETCQGPFVGKPVASQVETLDAALCKGRELQQVINATQTQQSTVRKLRVVNDCPADQAVAFCQDELAIGNSPEGCERSGVCAATRFTLISHIAGVLLDLGPCLASCGHRHR